MKLLEKFNCGQGDYTKLLVEIQKQPTSYQKHLSQQAIREMEEDYSDKPDLLEHMKEVYCSNLNINEESMSTNDNLYKVTLKVKFNYNVEIKVIFVACSCFDHAGEVAREEESKKHEKYNIKTIVPTVIELIASNKEDVTEFIAN